MNEKLVVAMAGLLNISADVLNETDETKIQSVIDSLKNFHVFNNGELETLKKNQVDKAIELLSDPKQQLPQAIYKRVQGTVLEATEGRIKKKHGFTGDSDGIDDLVDKIIAEKSTSTDTEISLKYEKLKSTVKEIEAEKAAEVEKANTRVNVYIVNDRLNQALTKIPLDYTDDELPSARKTYLNDFLAGHDVKIENDKLIVTNKETGKPILNRVGDPEDLFEVLKAAKPAVIKLKDAPGGGRGDKTKPPAGTGYQGITDKESYYKYLETNNIDPNSAKAVEVIREVVKVKPEFSLK